MPLNGEKLNCQCVPLDILSSLPDDVITDILVHLPLRDAVRTSILSKKWRDCWCRLPVLMLDKACLETTDGLITAPIRFTYIMNHLLARHVGPITKFTLSLAKLGKYHPMIDNLICFLSRSGIQHLVLELLGLADHYKMHSSLFACLHLKHLTLHNCFISRPPAVKGFDRLICLELYDVTICSEFLESLISNPLLEQLVLHDVFFNHIEISAPLLRSFDFFGNTGSICLKNIPSLAKLSLMHTKGDPVSNSAVFVDSLPKVKILHLNDNFLKIWASGAGEVTTRLPCVERLYLTGNSLHKADVVSHALRLIGSFPLLQYLEYKVIDDDDDEDEDSDYDDDDDDEEYSDDDDDDDEEYSDDDDDDDDEYEEDNSNGGADDDDDGDDDSDVEEDNDNEEQQENRNNNEEGGDNDDDADDNNDVEEDNDNEEQQENRNNNEEEDSDNDDDEDDNDDDDDDNEEEDSDTDDEEDDNDDDDEVGNDDDDEVGNDDDDVIPALESFIETFDHLKEVKLERVRGTKPEMQLIKLLLAKAPVLERMVVEPCIEYESLDTNTVKFAQLTKFQRASSKASVVCNLGGTSVVCLFDREESLTRP